MAATATPTQASWNGQSSTIPAFINSLFSSSVRSLSAVQSQIAAGQHSCSFTDDATRGLILNAWLAAWQNTNGDNCSTSALAMCPAADKALIGFLSQYIKTNNLLLCQPNLTYVSPQPSGSTFAVYSNSGYQTHQFLTNGKWNYGVVSSDGQLSNGDFPDDTVVNFLFQLFHGAHFVAVSNATDLLNKGATQQFWDAFHASDLNTSGDKVNSHYGSANLTGYYYLNITRDSPPSNPPLMLAFLAGLTNPAEFEVVSGVAAAGATVTLAFVPGGEGGAVVAAGTTVVLMADSKSRRDGSNTFIQLEGWQNHFPYFGGWHMADYDAHKATLWNFSTFGVSVYSEKRSTPIFLANTNFPLGLTPATKMPSYNGAMALEPWMNTSLLQT